MNYIQYWFGVKEYKITNMIAIPSRAEHWKGKTETWKKCVMTQKV